MKKKLTNVLVCIITLVLLICSVPVTADAATPKLTNTKLTLYPGQKYTLSVSNAGNKKITWKSSKKSVASVGKKGVVTAKKAGSAKITAKVGKKKVTCQITVKKPSLNITSKTIYIGQNFTLNPKPATLPIKWSSSKSSVATVLSGKVTGKAAGTATITGTIYGKKYTCKVTVKSPTLNQSDLSMGIGETYHLVCTDSSLTVTSWSSSSPGIASVDNAGVIKAFSTGTATITAKILGKKYTCKITVTPLSPYAKYGIPDYWKSELDKSIATIYDNEMTMSAHSAQFLYFTDVHWYKNAKRSPAILNYLSPLLNMNVIFGGDIISTYATSKQAAAEEIRDFYNQFQVPVFTAIGNHDSNQMSNPDASSILNENEMYSLLLRQEESLANTESTIDHAYFDNVSQKVRYISFFFDAHVTISSELYDWIDQRISELPKGWTVILFSHASWTPKEAGFTLPMSGQGQQFINHILELESKVDATVACWMTGHVHRDYNQTFTSKDNRLLVISNNCDTYKISSKWGGWDMTAGTSTEQCIDAVQIDLDARKIYMTRIGAGEDRVFSY